MSLHPHLHLLISSSTPLISLEARLYLPSPSTTSLPLVTSRLKTSPRNGSSPDILASLAALSIERLITVSHPWGKLGGNMLDPVIASHLISAVYEDGFHGPSTAVLSYNARDVGQSGGGSGWFGFPGVVDVLDFEAVERWGSEALDVGELWRMGYSWGTLTAISKSTKEIRSTLLISPAITAFSALSYIPFTHLPSFLANLNNAMKEGRKVWILYGTEDEFTGVKGFRSLVKDTGGVVGREVEGAGHFFRENSDGQSLVQLIREWVRA